MSIEIEVTILELLGLNWEYYKRSKLYSQGKTFEEFCAIHKYDIEELKDNLPKYDLIIPEKGMKNEVIQFLESGALKKMMKDCRKSLKNRLGREPNANEFIEGFDTWLEELLSKLKENIVELKELEKKTPSVKGLINNKGKFSSNVEVPKYKKMKRYLKAYDLKKNKYKIMDIGRLIYPAKDIEKWSEENMKRRVLRDIQKAKKIIENVEQFEFPGKF